MKDGDEEHQKDDRKILSISNSENHKTPSLSSQFQRTNLNLMTQL